MPATVKFPFNDPVDFLVIGAGAAGGVMAKELSTAGFRVVVLEQGPYRRPGNFQHDELDVTFHAGLTNDTRLRPQTFRKTARDKATVRPAVEYGSMVGGGSVHFTANYWRLHASDFHERSLHGPVPGSSFADWPITYDELEPYYTKAEWELGISGLGGANPFESPRSRPYPLPPMPVKSSGVLFEAGARKLGLHPYPAPLAILSQPYRGRAACLHCGFCESFGCEVGAKSSTLAALIPSAEKTGRCEIRANSYVRRIETDKSGRVTGAVYFDAARREIFQSARAVVVCANGAETPRLLLMSSSNLFPNGLANSSGMVGKNLMFDCGLAVRGLFDHPLNDYKSVQTTRVLHDFYDADPKRGFYGGGGLDARFDWYPISFALGAMPEETPKWGAGFKAACAEYFTHTMTILAHATCLSVESNTISLDPDVKDAWGLPAMRVTFQYHPDDMKNVWWLVDRQREIMHAAGARKVWTDDLSPLDVSRHLMGACRMGHDPRATVVDPFHRAHDVPNLFLVDGSSFVTSGRQQPTCTIQALAYRAADHLTQAARRGAI